MSNDNIHSIYCIHLALDLDGGVLAFVNVDSLPHIGVFNDNRSFGVALVLNNPLLALKLTDRVLGLASVNRH